MKRTFRTIVLLFVAFTTSAPLVAKGNTNNQKTYLDYALEGKCPVAELHGGSFSDCSSHSYYSLYLYDERIFKDENVNPLYLCHKAAECYSACKLMENYFEKDDYRITIGATSNHRVIRKVCADYIDCLAFSLFLGGEASTIAGDLHDLSVSLMQENLNSAASVRRTSETLDILGGRIRKNGVYEPFKIMQKALLKFDVLNKECQISSGIDSESPKKVEGNGVKNQTNLKNGASQEQQTQPPPGGKTIVLSGNVKLEMMKVEAGTFTMSAKDGENISNEVPHQATLTKDFYLGQTEVTQAQWKAVMGSNPSDNKGDNLPVENVSWSTAMSFCEKLNSTGKAPNGWKFTLPTETQWEYAARGGNKSKGYKYSGSNDIDEVAWYKSNADGKSHPVGQKKANELGLYDMCGNVAEWCLDDWNDDSSKQKAEFTRENNFGSADRAVRSSSWGAIAKMSRSSARLFFKSDLRNSFIGLRLVLVPADGYGAEKQTNGKNVTPQTQTPQKQTPPGDKTFVLADNIKLEMMIIKAGSFEMSAKDGENDDDEVPHQATLTKDFYLGQTEVTQAQWQAVMGNNPSGNKGDNLPVEQVSWLRVMDFCEKLNSMGLAPNGWKFTLPTETQWEYAARGGNKSKGYKYSGSNDIDEVAWYKSNADGKSHPVGQKKANELGLYDMSGNVCEFCLDDWNDDSSKQKAEFTRGNDISFMPRVLRGGSWSYNTVNCRSPQRFAVSQLRIDNMIGFRVALVQK